MLTILFFGIQTVSIAVMILFIHEYKRITYKHHRLLENVENASAPKSIPHSTIIIWIYAAVTFGILIGTTVLFYTELPAL